MQTRERRLVKCLAQAAQTDIERYLSVPFIKIKVTPCCIKSLLRNISPFNGRLRYQPLFYRRTCISYLLISVCTKLQF